MAKSMNKKKMNIIILGFFLLGITSVSLCSTGTATVATYEIALNKGTITFRVNKYNEDKWEDTIDDESEPDDWFGGDSDDVGAKSKITIRNIANWKWDLYDALISIFDIQSRIPDDLPNTTQTILFLSYLSKDYVDEVYTEKYEVWEAITVKWEFESEEFKESPDESENIMPIFKTPKDYRDLLEDYNEWALTVNSTMILLGIEPYPILNGDEFLLTLIKSRLFTIAQPFKNYLNALIDELDCKDTIVKENKLIIELKGEGDYNIEAVFNDQGILSNIIIKNEDDRIIYEIVQDTTDVMILIISGIIGICLAGVLSIIIRRRNNLRE